MVKTTTDFPTFWQCGAELGGELGYDEQNGGRAECPLHDTFITITYQQQGLEDGDIDDCVLQTCGLLYRD